MGSNGEGARKTHWSRQARSGRTRERTRSQRRICTEPGSVPPVSVVPGSTGAGPPPTAGASADGRTSGTPHIGPPRHEATAGGVRELRSPGHGSLARAVLPPFQGSENPVAGSSGAAWKSLWRRNQGWGADGPPAHGRAGGATCLACWISRVPAVQQEGTCIPSGCSTAWAGIRRRGANGWPTRWYVLDVAVFVQLVSCSTPGASPMCSGCRRRGHPSGQLRDGEGRTNGNVSTSRMVALSVSSITSRSTPMPRPPAGGMPVSRA